VQETENGNLSLHYQKLTSASLQDYPEFCTPENNTIQRIIDEFSPVAIKNRFGRKTDKPTDFMKGFCTPENLEKLLTPYVQTRMHRILQALKGTGIYLYERDNPTHAQLFVEEKPADAIFHFERGPEGTKYYPVLFHQGRYLDISVCKCHLLVNENAWILVGKSIYHFPDNIDGIKLKAFFDKPFIQVQKSSEKIYFQKFVRHTAEHYPVVFKGVSTSTLALPPVFLGTITRNYPNVLHIKAQYGANTIDIDSRQPRLVSLKNTETDFEAICYERQMDAEQHLWQVLEGLGLEYKKNARFVLPEGQSLMAVINEHFNQLRDLGLSIELLAFEKKFRLCQPYFSLTLHDSGKTDWFDVKAIIRFGEFEVPFAKLKRNILDKDPHYKLPNGEYALIPEAWFAQYRYLFAFSENHDQQVIIKKQFEHLLSGDGLGVNGIDSHETSADLAPARLPVHLSGVLREYQKVGFEWMWRLKETGRGGVLADDMGLGKTLQTITLLSAVYQSGKVAQIDLFNFAQATTEPTLIVVPTSLVHNWAHELDRFAPQLTYLVHYGPSRAQNAKAWKNKNVVITTYGLIRNDLELLQTTVWKYLILDESHYIKNPMAKVTKHLGLITASHRLALTGTPIENSLTDLWSQMNFLNPGVLGSFSFFKSEFVIPIEKNDSEIQKITLKKLTFPYIMRRTKEEVAPELPPLTEQLLYCEMDDLQAQLYEEVKSQYRNLLTDASTLDMKNRFVLLKGLTELRLIANHPRMYDPQSTLPSGKFFEIAHRLLEIHERKHKILVFSQFTRHLALFEEYLQRMGIAYSLLTGKTRDRQSAVGRFTQGHDCNIFLISLKAGGTGLNLTQADYVFVLDPWWNPFAEKQAIDRAYRIGQDKSVFSYKFIAKASIEEKILRLQERKRLLAKEFIPAAGSLDFDIEDLRELFA
jgi:superfamily II DNA or RNA helicase